MRATSNAVSETAKDSTHANILAVKYIRFIPEVGNSWSVLMKKVISMLKVVAVVTCRISKVLMVNIGIKKLFN